MFPTTAPLRDGTALTIREADPDDAAALLRHVHALSGETEFITFGPGEFSMTEAQERDFLAHCQRESNQLFLLALLDGAIAGTLHFGGGNRPRTRHTGAFGVSVRRAQRGLGVGSALLDCLIAWARAHEYVAKLNLRVRVDNAVAIALYEKKGFVHEGTISREMQLDGVFHDAHCMGLQV
jgi:RimJ/RimL family protein N-acetyltransferase